MKYDTKQRNEIYKKAYLYGAKSKFIEIASEYKNHVGMCFTICRAAKIEIGWNSYKTLLEDFIELWLFEDENNIYWFSHDKEGKNERLTALAFMIAMTE